MNRGSTGTNVPSEVEIAWATGLYEGEGSVIAAYHYRHRQRDGSRRRYPRISLLMTTEEPVREIARIFGRGTVRVNKRRMPHHKDGWRWTVDNWTGTVAIFHLMRPWLSPRRIEQFERVFEECEESRRWTNLAVDWRAVP